jgi:hypothetical protein
VGRDSAEALGKLLSSESVNKILISLTGEDALYNVNLLEARLKKIIEIFPRLKLVGFDIQDSGLLADLDEHVFSEMAKSFTFNELIRLSRTSKLMYLNVQRYLLKEAEFLLNGKSLQRDNFEDEIMKLREIVERNEQELFLEANAVYSREELDEEYRRVTQVLLDGMVIEKTINRARNRLASVKILRAPLKEFMEIGRDNAMKISTQIKKDLEIFKKINEELIVNLLSINYAIFRDKKDLTAVELNIVSKIAV